MNLTTTNAALASAVLARLTDDAGADDANAHGASAPAATTQHATGNVAHAAAEAAATAHDAAAGATHATLAATAGATHGSLAAAAQGEALTAFSFPLGLQALMQQTRLAQQPIQAAEPGPASQARRAQGQDGSTEQVKQLFKDQFASKAANREEFHAFMQQVYGDGYDRNAAEQLRQRALAGDFSWLPDVKLVDAGTLGGGNGAYNAEEGVVYISRELAASDPNKAAQTFVEEAGHHIDTLVNQADTRGDEGEMFRRVLSGENLSANELAAIRNENDKGSIVVDGKRVEVEFWFGEDIVDAVGDAATSAADAVADVATSAADGVADVATSAVDIARDGASDIVDHAGNALRDVAYSLGDAVKEGVMGVVQGAGSFAKGVAYMFGGSFISLIQGKPADAWDTFLRGLDMAVIEAPRRVFNGMLEGAGHVFKTMTYWLPEKAGGAFLRDVIDRGVDSVRTIGNGVIDVARNFIRLPFEIGVGIAKDIGEVLRYIGRGDFGEAAERLGLTLVNPIKRVGGAFVDSAMIVAQAGGNVFGNVTGLHEPSRGLSKQEREDLKSIYGDSLNLEDIRIHRKNVSHELGMAPHCVGNDIYLPDDCFNADGTLNEKGRLTLVHEAFHVYQAQHGGNDYIHNALLAQAEGIVDNGNRNTAYDWVAAMREGKRFSEWNAEQQAEYFETLARAKWGTYLADPDGDGVFTREDYDLNNNGQIEMNELELAWVDRPQNGRTPNGRRDTAPAGSPPGTPDPEPAANLTNEEFQQLMAIWNGVKDDRPDRTVI